jgi:Cof subfamily protein (haloacid dehalogenase superfamily)
LTGIDLVCIDVDGTLVGASGDVLPEVWAAARRTLAAGVHLAICSGRPAFGITRTFAERLNPAGWHIFQNGASVLRLDDHASRSEPIPGAIVFELIARSRHHGRLLELYTDESYAFEIINERARAHARLLGVPFSLRSFDSLGGPVVRAQWVVSDGEAAAILGEPHAGLEIGPATSPTMPNTAFLNMTRTGVNKAVAVRTVAAAYDIPLSRVMFVGDGHNDVGAMSIVGLPVAMGNAERAVQAVARRQVAHVDEAGLIEALDIALSTRNGVE